MKISATGYYGFSNFGDDLFVIAIDIAARKYWRNHELTAIAPRLKDTSTIKYAVPSWISKELYARNNLLAKFMRFYFIISSMHKTDLILNAGGTTISSASSSKKLNLQALLRRPLQCKIAGIGLSIGPFTSDSDSHEAIEVLKGFDYISVRDQTSYEQLRAHPMISAKTLLSADMAGLVASHYKFYNIPKNDLVTGISLMEMDYKNNEEDFKLFTRSIINHSRKEKKTLRIFSLNTHETYGDNSICHDFIETLRANSIDCEIILHNDNALDTWRKIAECSQMISFRLHGAIAAYLSNVPFLLIEHHRKCSDFLDDIKYQPSHRTKNIRDGQTITAFLDSPAQPLVSHDEYIDASLRSFSEFPA